jgi:phosphohistidine phosphatase SixA
MKTLYLLRHAKSSWADTEIDDLDRPLAPRPNAPLRRSPTTCASKG